MLRPPPHGRASQQRQINKGWQQELPVSADVNGVPATSPGAVGGKRVSRRWLIVGLSLGALVAAFVFVAMIAVRQQQQGLGSGSPPSYIGQHLAVNALLRGGGIERLADGSRAGSDTPYPVHQILDVEVLRHATTRILGSGATSDQFPPITDPQQVFGHALMGFVQPVPSFTGELLAGISVNEEFAPEGSQPWQISWVARVGEGGDVTIYEGGEERWDEQLAGLAALLQRDDQAALLVDWVTEALAVKEGAAPGPISVAFNAAFVPPELEPEPLPSIEVPIFVRFEASEGGAGDKVVVGVGWFDVEEDFVYPEDYEPEERLFSEGSGLMTGLMASGTMMRIDVWDDGMPIAATSLLPEQWEPVISGQAGGI